MQPLRALQSRLIQPIPTITMVAAITTEEAQTLVATVTAVARSSLERLERSKARKP